MSNLKVLTHRRSPDTKKNHCVQWGFSYRVHSGGLTINTLWGISARWAHRIAIRSKLAGATLSNLVVLTHRRSPDTKKPHCMQWGFSYRVHSGGLTINTLWGISARWAHRIAIRSKLAGATLSNLVVLTHRRSPDTKKPHCMQWGFSYMVHSGGFEPPTARFVAGYSIQLSYECFTVSLQRSRTIGVWGGCVNNP